MRPRRSSFTDDPTDQKGQTMAVDTTTATELTAEQVQHTLVQPLEAASTFLSSGVRIFDTASQLRLPKGPKAQDVSFVGENEQIPEIDPDFGELTLLPSTMKSIKTLTRYSNELARQSVIALDAALKDRLVSDVAAKIDAQFLGAGGDGTTTPRGLFGFPDTQQVNVGGPLTLDTVLQGLALLVKANVPTSGLKLFIQPDDYLAIRGTKDTTGRFIIAPENSQGLGVNLLGITPVLTARVPAGSAAIVAPSQVAVARDLAPTVKILTKTYGDYDQQAIRVVCRYDAAPLNPEAIVKFTGVTAG